MQGTAFSEFGEYQPTTMAAEYHLVCTACSFDRIVDGQERTLEKQAEHEHRHGPKHFVEFKQVGEPSKLFPQ